MRAKRTGTHRPVPAILQKLERLGDVVAKAIEPSACGRRSALGALPGSGDFAERREEVRSTYRTLSHAQRA